MDGNPGLGKAPEAERREGPCPQGTGQGWVTQVTWKEERLRQVSGRRGLEVGKHKDKCVPDRENSVCKMSVV